MTQAHSDTASRLGGLLRKDWLWCLAALMLGAGAASASPAGTESADAVIAPMHLGAMTVLPLQDATDAIPNDGKVFGFGIGSAAVAQVLADAGLPQTSIPLSVNALLVRGRGRVMLFDTGLGVAHHGHLLDGIHRHGVLPGDVTDIFLTHSHGDHTGGLLDAMGELVFPNAVVHISAPEWHSMIAAAQRDAPLVAALHDRVRLFTPGAVVVPGVRSVSLTGHTPGHVGYRIGSGGQSILDIGDLVHSSIVSLAKPDWALGFDKDQALGARMRRLTLARVAKTGELVFAPHFPYPGVGRIAETGDHFAWQPQARN